LKLGVNVDHVATVRQARHETYPDPVEAALLAEAGGADSIVCHLREDRRHVQDRDLPRLKSSIRTRLNLEMAMSEEIVRIALALKPDQVTLVPERRQELTTEGGLDVRRHRRRVAEIVSRFLSRGIEVSLFIEPEDRAVGAAREAGARIVELHTGRYCEAARPKAELRRLRKAVLRAQSLGLVVAAGHGLNLSNIEPICCIPGIVELNIGHSIVGRAMMVGMKEAVREIKALMSKGGRGC
jgi:pyridoxine 5-phosphate synthase